jgi:RimJ/RimL family protein N-acetyltransferase
MTWPLEFRPMDHADLPLLHEWIERPHVKRFYGDHGTYEDVVDHYLPALEGRDPTEHHIVLVDGRSVGMVQTYLVKDYPAHAALMGVAGDEGIAGVDILVGEEELTGRGLGSEILRRFVDEIVFARSKTVACIADPAVDNAASVRAFEKAGFRVVSEHVDPADGLVHAVVRRDR